MRVAGILGAWGVQAWGTALAVGNPERYSTQQAVAHLVLVVAVTVALLSPAADRWVRDGG